MPTAVIMPKQGQSVESCIITKWFRKKGDQVSFGEILFSYETDKAAFDLESPVEGTLLEIFFDEGAEVPVLVDVAIIGKPGEIVPEKTLFPDSPSATAEATITPNALEAVKVVQAVNAMESAGSRIRISPRAKKMAESKGIDYSNLKGTGPNGRIVAKDIEDSDNVSPIVQQPALTVDEYTEQPLSNVRKLISKAMYSSLQNSAQLTHHMSADVRSLLEARQNIKKKMLSGKNCPDITLNDMVCWCVIRALAKFPEANSHFLEDRIRVFKPVHLGLAVDTPRGLMVPVARNAQKMSLEKLSTELKSIADSSRKGNMDPELLKSTAATFSVSNLGNYGVEMFTPVINLPQVAILGVCTIINRPANLGNNTFGFVPYIGLSLTYDHRAIDGGPATLFLKEIKEQIEAFSMPM